MEIRARRPCYSKHWRKSWPVLEQTGPYRACGVVYATVALDLTGRCYAPNSVLDPDFGCYCSSQFQSRSEDV